MTLVLIILAIILLYFAVILLMRAPGCTGNCLQGRAKCDCVFRKDKDDIRQDKRP
jgi:hypothetical protein